MDKQSVLEQVLGTSLNQEQVSAIKKEWNAFYSNPTAYRDTIVIDMVKLSLIGR
jgi:hypothetical protein